MSGRPMRERGALEYALVLAGGMGFSFNSGYINGLCISAFDDPGRQAQSVAGLTGAYTKTALGAAGDDGDSAGFQICVILSFILGSFVVGFVAPRRSAWKLQPEYGPLFLLGAAFLAASTVMAHKQDKQGRGVFYWAAMANGLQNGMTSLYSGNLIRTAHLTGTSTDIGLLVGQMVRGNLSNLWKLKVLIALALSFFIGSFSSHYAAESLGVKALIVNCVAFTLIGAGYLLMIVQRQHVSWIDALFGRWDWDKAAAILASHYEKDFNDIFDEIDRDGSNTVELIELHRALNSTGRRVSMGSVKQLLRSADTDGDGHLDRSEFVKMMSIHVATTDDPEETIREIRRSVHLEVETDATPQPAVTGELGVEVRKTSHV